ncbi:MAG: aminotransferase class V-fold PLP-dependent enzyme [Gammaproteobacteria bacterium]
MQGGTVSHHHPEFPQDPGLIYLNHAAVAPWPARTAEAVRRFAEENLRVGALHYARWLETEQNLRESLRALLNAASADDIALLKNTSEALSVVAHGLDWRPGDVVITARQEFPSNRVVWESLREQGVEVRLADLSEADTPEEALIALADERTRLLSISSVQYGTGLRMDLARLGRYCHEHGILFCIDAIQSLGALRMDVQAIQADFVMADGHKWMLGPEGLAVFYATPGARERLRLRQYGWHMLEHPGDYDRLDWRIAPNARRFECGSPNMLGIHALQASLSLLHETGMANVERAVLQRAVRLFDLIREHDELELLTPTAADRHGGIVTFRHRTADAAALWQHLTRCGVVCAVRGGGIRFSPHFYTPLDQLERAVESVLSYKPHAVA